MQNRLLVLTAALSFSLAVPTQQAITFAASLPALAGSVAARQRFPQKLAAYPQTASSGKQPAAHDSSMHDAHSEMNQRGEQGMGFSQTATTHHFLLAATGGSIQVEANDPADSASRDQIRMHLRHIAAAFAAGDFQIPMFVHDTVPPGAPEMKRLRSKISYTYQETPRGGRVVISTRDKNALAAIHRFLRFQITEHKTGDLLEVR